MRSSCPASQELDATSSLQPVYTVEADKPPVASGSNPGLTEVHVFQHHIARGSHLEAPADVCRARIESELARVRRVKNVGGDDTNAVWR